MMMTMMTMIIIIISRCRNDIAFKCYNHHCAVKWAPIPPQPVALCRHVAVVAHHLTEVVFPACHVLQRLKIRTCAQQLNASHELSVTGRCDYNKGNATIEVSVCFCTKCRNQDSQTSDRSLAPLRSVVLMKNKINSQSSNCVSIIGSIGTTYCNARIGMHAHEHSI